MAQGTKDDILKDNQDMHSCTLRTNTRSAVPDQDSLLPSSSYS